MARGEFELIRDCLVPLAAGRPETFDLANDAALLDVPAGSSLVTTADCLVEGLHFRAEDPPGRIAQKALRVNLSDLAAMGAQALGYLLTLALPRDHREGWLDAFVAGLSEDQARFGASLLGGDTTGTDGPFVVTVTAFGLVPQGRCLTRSEARADDLLFVSGSIGDAVLGLRALRGDIVGLTESDRHFLTDRYQVPTPRLALGQALLAQGLATAALDVSDGLVADLGHILAGSGLGARVEGALVPLSAAGQKLEEGGVVALQELITGGDDYELLFSAPAGRRDHLAALSRALSLPITEIGQLNAEGTLVVTDRGGQPLPPDAGGWRHF